MGSITTTPRYRIKNAEADLKQADYGVKAAEADLNQAQIGVKIAQADLEISNDNFKKITYPYTYSTFAFDVPQALDSISKAERSMADAQKVMAQTGLTPDQYAQAALKLKQAQDDLADARQRLARGQGVDVFASGQAAAQDFWTLRNAQIAMTKAQLGVENAESLLNKARLSLDTARGVAVKAQLALDINRNLLNKAQTGVQSARNALNKYQIAADKARYDLESAKESLSKGTIIAPFDGIAAKINVKAGDVLTPANQSQTVIEFIDPGSMEVSVLVDEMDIPGVKVGQEASISVDALPGEKYKGRVNFISALPEVRSGVVQYEVRISLETPNPALKAGMRCTTSIVKIPANK